MQEIKIGDKVRFTELAIQEGVPGNRIGITGTVVPDGTFSLEGKDVRNFGVVFPDEADQVDGWRAHNTPERTAVVLVESV
jgi:hypothetical protein